MRNDNSDTYHRSLDRTLNHQIKALAKPPSQTLGRGSVFYRLIDLGTNKKDDFKKYDKQKNKSKDCDVEPLIIQTNPQSIIANDSMQSFNQNNEEKSRSNYYSSFVYSEKIKESLNKDLKDSNLKSAKINNSDKRFNKVQASEKNVKRKEVLKSSSEDSRVTGGGGDKAEGSETNVVSRLRRVVESNVTSEKQCLTKRNSKDSHPTRKVSFKVRNPSNSVHRKHGNNGKILATLSNSKVASLTKKFNEMVSENNNLLKEPKISVIIDKKQNTKKNNLAFENVSSTLPPGINLKVITHNKSFAKRRSSLKSKTPSDASNASIDKVHLNESPVPHRKVLRVRSDITPRKRNSMKRKPKENINECKSVIYNPSKAIPFLHKKDGSNDFNIPESVEIKKSKGYVRRKPSFKTSPTRHSGSVFATIQLFEPDKKKKVQIASRAENGKINGDDLSVSKESSSESIDQNNSSTSKPKVPEKKTHLIKTKNLVIRDGRPKIKTMKLSEVNIEELHKGETLEEGNEPCEVKNERITNNLIQSDVEIKNYKNHEKKKDLIYDKTKARKSFLHGMKLHVIDDELNLSSDEPEKPSTNITQLEEVIPTSVSAVINDENNEKCDDVATDEEKLYQEVSARIKPNESFLWRTNSKNELIPVNAMSEYYETKTIPLNSEIYNFYDFVGPSTTTNLPSTSSEETVYTSFETILKKADNLLEHKKKEIANALKTEKLVESQEFLGPQEAINTELIFGESNLVSDVVEAINSLAITDLSNISKEIACYNPDEDYETVEPYVSLSDSSNKSLSLNTSNTSLKSHNKNNCPLPEVPKSNNDNIYQCLEDLRSQINDDNSSLHSYEYCHSKPNNNKGVVFDVDSDDGYEYCKAPKEESNDKADESHDSPIQPLPPKRKTDHSIKGFSLLKSDSITSSIGYEKISSIYEKIPPKIPSKATLSNNTEIYSGSNENYDECNCDENIYDTIKHSDTNSVSNCYESIPGSPQSTVKLKRREKLHPQLLPNSRLSLQFDAVSNFSQSCSASTISSDQKTNSIYGQRSIVSFGRSETITYGRAPSEISSSDRSDDWEDMSDQESSEDPTIIIVRERTRGRRSPASWSRKVRHQWNMSPKKRNPSHDLESSDTEHLYESLSHHPPLSDHDDRLALAVDDFDSFDSDSESEGSFVQVQNGAPDITHTQLPDVPTSSNIYTLTRFASAAGKKMKQLKRNFTKSTRKKLSESTSKSSLLSSPPLAPRVENHENKITKPKDNKTKQESVYQNTRFPLIMSDEDQTKQPNPNGTCSPNYQNIIAKPSPENQLERINVASDLNSQLESVLSQRKMISCGNLEDCVNGGHNDSQISGSHAKADKNSGVLSRKTYLSFKSKFKRSISASESRHSPGTLCVTNSTFYLNETQDNAPAINKRHSEIPLVTDRIPEPPIAPLRRGNKKSNAVVEAPAPIRCEVAISPEVKKSPEDLNNSNSSRSSRSRPSGPPPPPPPCSPPTTNLIKQIENKKDKRSINTTSWYAECGLFKANEAFPDTKERKSSASWYAEIGLYQAGNISTSSGASSTLSGGGTCSTTTAPSPPTTPVPPLGMFNQEPLYQFYDAAKIESVCRELDNESDSDGYEEIANFKEGERCKPIQRPSAMALINPLKGPSRTLWCEIPEVKNSGILCTLTPNQKKLQEAMFEIITSEASYLNSLTVLELSFMHHPAFQDEQILSYEDKTILFGKVLPVKKCSERLMADLETCWQESILLRGLCKIIQEHAEKSFSVYVTYCENQVYLLKTLKRLKTDQKLTEILSQLQCQPACQSLALHSFLMLPMQRVTRLPLLIDAVLKKIEASDYEYQPCMDALATLNDIVSQCNEGARKYERIDEMASLATQIEFPSNINEIAICPKSTHNLTRWLVRSGELTHLVWRGDDQSKLTFGKKYNKFTLHLFLFTDLLIITKKKCQDSYIVVDYCKRSLLEMTSSDMMAQSPVKETTGKHIVLLTMLENCENKTVEMLLSCGSETDRQRWMEACLPPPSENPDETVYEGWDCPQVTTMYSYLSTQPDELNLQQGDIVNVTKKMADGWYHGERLRDGEKGWFPGNYTVEIASAHVRARNLRQRYRLLALSGTYLGQQKKNKS